MGLLKLKFDVEGPCIGGANQNLHKSTFCDNQETILTIFFKNDKWQTQVYFFFYIYTTVFVQILFIIEYLT